MPIGKNERHRTERIGWLRAAVLGANDGILSTSSLVLGVAASRATHSSVVVAGIAGLVAGAMSMAAGGNTIQSIDSTMLAGENHSFGVLGQNLARTPSLLV